MKLPLIALTESEGDPYRFSHLCLFKKKCDLDWGPGISYCQRHPEGRLTPDRKNTPLLTFFLHIFSHLLIFNSFIIHFMYSRIFLSVEDNRAVAFNRRTFHAQKLYASSAQKYVYPNMLISSRCSLPIGQLAQ